MEEAHPSRQRRGTVLYLIRKRIGVISIIKWGSFGENERKRKEILIAERVGRVQEH